MRSRTLTALAALALLLPATAAAQTPGTNAPPGNSAIDEYLETVPATTGNAPPRPPGSDSGALPASERKQLEALGKDGETLAAVVEATSPAPARKPSRKPAPAIPAPAGQVEGATASHSPLKAALTAAVGPSDGEGMGALLPVILLTSLLGVMAIAALRKRPLR